MIAFIIIAVLLQVNLWTKYRNYKRADTTGKFKRLRIFLQVRSSCYLSLVPNKLSLLCTFCTPIIILLPPLLMSLLTIYLFADVYTIYMSGFLIVHYEVWFSVSKQ